MVNEEKECKEDMRWIPCSERLMPDAAGCECLVSAVNKNYPGLIRTIVAFTGYGDFKWHSNHACYDMDNWDVIAWMPVPKPYKKEENDGEFR